jgi:hypothetical protein
MARLHRLSLGCNRKWFSFWDQLQHLNPNPLQNYLPGESLLLPPLAFELFSLHNIHLFLCIYKVMKPFVALFLLLLS